MKLRRTKWLAFMMAAALLVESAGMNVVAATDVTGGDVAELVGTELVVGVTAGDVSGDVSAADVTMGDVTAGDMPVADVTTGDVTAGDVSENETVVAVFPGLPEGYAFSAAQLSAKAELATYSGEIIAQDKQQEDGAYKAGEVVYLTDSEAEAQMVAEAFGGRLDSFEAGVAVIALAEDVTVSQAVCAAADQNILLPAVWPNYVKQYYVLDYEGEYDDPFLYDYKSRDYFQWQHDFVGSYYVWQAGYTGKGVNVAIVDSGALSSHEELSANLKKNVLISEDGTSVTDNTGDLVGHGTHVSGITSAVARNDKGGAGIAPDSNLYVYALGKSPESAAIMRAIKLAIADGADVLNMSFGSGYYDGNENSVMQEAYQNGVALFAAAGNDSTYNATVYPAGYENVCAIASLQRDGALSGFSNSGSMVELAFPGTDILSTTVDGKYDMMSGTSMASPVATGVAAVILSGAKDIPELADKTGKDRVDALYKVMADGAKKSPSKGTGAGTTYLPDVLDVVVEDYDAVIAAPTFSIPTNTVICKAKTELVLSCENKLRTGILYTLDGSNPSIKNGKLQKGTYEYRNSISIGETKKVTVKAMAYNFDTGKTSKISTATYTFEPYITGFVVQAVDNLYTVMPGKSTKLYTTIYPSFVSTKKVRWYVEENVKKAGVSVSSSGKVTVSKDTQPGSYQIWAKVVDNKGKTVLTENGNEVCSSCFIDVTTPIPVKKITVSQKAVTVNRYDENFEKNLMDLVTVTYTDGSKKSGKEADLRWTSSNSAVAMVTYGGGAMILGPGKTKIKVLANDGTGKSATITLTVMQKAQSVQIKSSLGAKSASLAPGKSLNMQATVYPNNVSNKKVVWSIKAGDERNEGKVTISKIGKVTAKKNATGTYEVTATTTDGTEKTSAVFPIQITSAPIKKITMQKSATLFHMGASGTVISFAPVIDGPEDAPYSLYSENPNVVSALANDGTFYASGVGTTYIYCKAMDGSGKVAKCKVTVMTPMSSLEIVPAEVNEYDCLYVGSSMKLNAVIGTSYGVPTSKQIKWSVAEEDKDKISISSSGVVKAKSLGKEADKYTSSVTARVYARPADGRDIEASYTITVKRKIKKLDLVSKQNFFNVIATMDNGQTTGVSYSISVAAADDKKVGVQKLWNLFQLIPEEATTTKTSDFTKADALKVTVTVKAHGCKKSDKLTVYIIKTQAGDVYVLD